MEHQNTLAAVLLAAGPSTRLGRPKQLVRFENETLVHRTARLLADLPLAQVMVVIGCEAERVRSEFEDLPVGVVFNSNWKSGMGSSIACGARAIEKSVDGVLLMVCDQWCLQKQDLSRMIDAWTLDISQVYVARWSEHKASISGPPVIFPRKVMPELKFLISSRGARQVIDRHLEIVEFVDLQNAAFDLDRPEDLEKMSRGRG